MERQSAAKTLRAEGPAAARAPAPAPEAPRPDLADRVMRLHRVVGNRAAGRFIQAKLRVGSPHDRSEAEADRVAEQVMRMPDPAAPVEAEPDEPEVRRACAACGPSDEEVRVQRRCQECEDEEKAVRPMAREGESGERHDPSIDEHALTKGGEPLPSPVRTFYFYCIRYNLS